MPAQIFITREQVVEMYELGESVIVLEAPTTAEPHGNILEFWVMDDASLGNTHRSVVVDPEGNRLGDTTLDDPQ